MNTSSAPAWGSHRLPTADFIQRVLDRIRADDAVEAELHNVRAYLLNILELVDRDPGIEAASDDLYAVAKEFSGGPDSRYAHILASAEAFLRFGDRLRSATPSEQARGKRGEVAPAVRLYHGAKVGRCENLHVIASLVQMPCHLQMSGRPKADGK